MSDSSIQEQIRGWSEFSSEDNRISEDVVSELNQFLTRSLVKYPLGSNLIAIFFADVVKIVAGALLRKREVDHGLVVDHPSLLRPRESFPYLGYRELRDGVDFSAIRFGKTVAIPQASRAKRVLSFLTSLRPVLGSEKTVLISANFSDVDLCLRALIEGIRIETLDSGSWTPRIPDRMEQLAGLRDFTGIIENRWGRPIPNFPLFEILSRHVLSTAEEGVSSPLPEADALVIASGTEMENRFLAAQARRQGMRVAVVMHGDSFGTIDNEVFGVFEQTFATEVIGYGDRFIKDLSAYRCLNRPGVRYYASCSPGVRRLKQARVRCTFPAEGLYYVPTSLRGSSQRYGLHQELVDKYYLEWQDRLLRHFDGVLRLKAHPKDKFLDVVRDVIRVPLETRNLTEILAESKLFVFDYVSTAFALAAATDRPIIFFDLGIQQFGPKVIENLKKRCIYVDVAREGLPSVEQLRARVETEEKNHEFVDDFSLSQNRGSRYGEFLTNLKESDRRSSLLGARR